MHNAAQELADRVRSIRTRAAALSEVRALVALPRERDLAPEQWAVIEPRLAATGQRIISLASRLAEQALPRANDIAVARALASSLGELESDLNRAYVVMDTFVDVLTQRGSPKLGALLRGCDVLAADALRAPLPALSTLSAPVTHCDRGAGASVIREGANMTDGLKSPIALVQIPYSRLSDKLSLVSLLHEVGHQALTHLGLVMPLGAQIGRAVADAGASSEIAALYARWVFELGPDFWAFGCSGIAQPYALRDVLSLSSEAVLRFSASDSHPSPRVRVELAFEFARAMFGAGPWDDARRTFASLYSIKDASIPGRSLLEEALRFVPVVARSLIHERQPALDGRALGSIFDRRSIDPERALTIARGVQKGRLALYPLRPAAQLSVFRWLREKRWLDAATLERTMTRWLLALGLRAPLFS